MLEETQGYRLYSSFQSYILSGIWFGVLVFGLVLISPALTDLPVSTELAVTVSFIAIWRYSWKMLHFTRATIYHFFVGPRRAKRAQELEINARHIFAIVTSYRMDAAINAHAYHSLFEDLSTTGIPATVVACITDQSDVEVIEQTLQEQEPISPISVIFLPQKGKGKRDVMADALDLLRERPHNIDDILILMDGDGLVKQGCTRKAMQRLLSDPSVGAVTTNNIPAVKGKSWTREWYRLRMIQRHVYMSSLALSKRLLVLTGRFSVFRCQIALAPEFSKRVRDDYFFSWKTGMTRMLTGDDKSTWFFVLKNGWNMDYVADAYITPLEELPDPSFLKASTSLMKRWYGNMLRNNARALGLGLNKVRPMLWFSLLDQRFSMWTAIYGPLLALSVSLYYQWDLIFLFCLWVLFVRFLNCLFLFLLSGSFHPLFMVLMLFDQYVGAVMKIQMLFKLQKQSWTRQGIGLKQKELSLAKISDGLLLVSSVGFFFVFIAFTWQGLSSAQSLFWFLN